MLMQHPNFDPDRIIAWVQEVSSNICPHRDETDLDNANGIKHLYYTPACDKAEPEDSRGEPPTKRQRREIDAAPHYQYNALLPCTPPPTKMSDSRKRSADDLSRCLESESNNSVEAEIEIGLDTGL